MTARAGTYVDYCGHASGPGPLDITGGALWAFLLHASEEALVALLDRVFAATTHDHVRCRPLGSTVMLSFGKFDCIRTRVPEYSSAGYVREHNTALWVPAALTVGHEDERFALFQACMWVDDPIALSSGRESYGYPKNWGRPTLPEPLAPGPFVLDAYAWDFRDGDCPAMRERLIAAEPCGERAESEREVEEPTTLEELTKRYGPEVLDSRPGPGSEGWGGHLFSDVLHGRLPQLFLRQFRAPWGGCDADLQQVVVADVKPGKIRARRLGRHTVSIKSFESHPLCEDLGLEAEQESYFGLAASLPVSVEAGAVLWSRPEVGVAQ